MTRSPVATAAETSMSQDAPGQLDAKRQLVRQPGDAAEHAPRRGDGRFANASGAQRPSLGDVLRWKLGTRGRDAHHERPCWDAIPRVEPAVELSRATPPAGLTWVGHSTVLMHLPGLTLLTDPVWHGLPGARRATAPGLPLAPLPALDAILISHDHHDHLQRRSIAALPADVPVLVPLGLGRWMHRQRRQQVIELDWWDSVELPGGRITFVPAQHWSRRGLADENKSLWGGYVITSNAGTIYFAGDSGWFDGFESIGKRLRPDIALLPIGAYAPRWFMRMQHIDPSEALDAFEALGARTLLPIHWGSFVLSDEPLGEPPAWLDELAHSRGLSEQLHLWPLGGTLWL